MKSGSITLLYMSLYDLVLNKYCSKVKLNAMYCKLDNLLGREFSLINGFLLPKDYTFLFFFKILSGLSTISRFWIRIRTGIVDSSGSHNFSF